jgi:hypothetical protein
MRTKLFLAAAVVVAVAELSFAARAQTTNEFLPVVQLNFARWDLDHDGVLSTNELDMATADGQTTNQNAAAVVALKRATRPKITVPPAPPLPPLTLENIAEIADKKQPDLERMFRDGLKRIAAATNRNLFADGLPKLETIHQGRLGNCFCLAPLGAMLQRDPAQVAAMFTVATNGTIAVRLGKKTVEVSPPTDAEIALTSANEQSGVWLNIYEKAVGAARNEDRPPEQRANSPIDAVARGGSAGTMLAYITGHEIARFSFKFAKEPASATNNVSAKIAELRKKLTAATQQHRLMTCGTIKPTTPGLTPNHAYALLEYDAAADAVRLWNPHGQNFQPKGEPGSENGYPTANGIFQLPLEQFVKQFSGMAFEVVETAAPKVSRR